MAELTLVWEIRRNGRRGDAPSILPLCMEEDLPHGILRVSCLRDFEPQAREFFAAFGKDPFTDKALRALGERLAPYFAARGYTPEQQGALRYYIAYRAECGEPPLPLPETDAAILLSNETDLLSFRNRTSFSLPLLIRRDRAHDIPFAAAVKDGEILSICAVNDPEEDDAVELTVQTAPAARGQGYAKAVCRAACWEMQSRGYAVLYCCSRYNRPSAAIAEALGFRKLGRFYAAAGFFTNHLIRAL